MQKSAQAHSTPRRIDTPRFDAWLDKGQKFEPFWSAAFGNDRRSLAVQQRADQKR